MANEGERVLVVGAGPAGLGTAAELQRRGIPVTVLERADVLAAPWRGSYDRLQLNTSRPFSQLPGLRFPRGAGVFPTRDSMVRYLEAYAAHHGLDVRLGTPVLRIDPVGPRATAAGRTTAGRCAHPAASSWPRTSSSRPVCCRSRSSPTGLAAAGSSAT